MKATGIVRRIDDLGRVVIPKEIRRTMRIREGDPLEIYTDGGGLVVFKKYSPLGELSAFAAQYAEALSGGTELAVAITDSDCFIAAAGMPKKDIIGREIPEGAEEIIAERKLITYNNDSGIALPLPSGERKICAVAPIIAAGDIVGSVMLVSAAGKTATEGDVNLLKVAAAFLGKQMEG